MQWYVLSNEIGTILAVYGSALSDMAVSQGEKLATEFPQSAIYLHNVTGNRPSVGGTISMLGQTTKFQTHLISKF